MNGRRERSHQRYQKKEWSKCITTIVVIFGFAIVQECFILMYLCITHGYTSTAAWLTAAVGLGEAVIGTGVTGYLSLCKSDHKEGGITYAKFTAELDEQKSTSSPKI